VRKRGAIEILEPFVFLLAAALWLAPLWRDPAGFAFWRPAAFTDLLVSHYPNAELVRRSLSIWGQVPLWNPSILSGAPFDADPLSGLFYPPYWLGILLPAGLGFNLVFLLHLAWAGWGAATLAESEGVGRAGRIFAGALFAGAPKLIGHIGLGHLTLVAAVAWTPWALLAAGKAAEAVRDPGAGWVRRFAGAGAVLGLVFLADPRWMIPSGLAAALYALGRLVRERPPARREAARALAGAGLFGVFAAGVAAVMALPLIEFVSLATRANLTGAERLAMQLPVAQLAGLFSPELGGWPEWMTYSGILTVGLGIGAILAWKRNARFWLIIVLLAWILSLGDQTPAQAILDALIPGAGLLRVPPRFLLLSALGLALLAGMGLDGLIASRPQGRLPTEAVGPLGVGLGLVVMAALRASQGGLPAGLAGAAALGAIAALWTVATLARAQRLLAPGLMLIAAVDLVWVGFSLLEVRDETTALSEREAIVEAAIEAPAGERTFSPSYSIPQQTASRLGLELADGVNPLQLRGYVQAAAEATGFDPGEYSVTLPPLAGEDLRQDWQPVLDLERLGLLSIGTIVSDYPLETAGLEEPTVVDGVQLYPNPQVRPRAWVEPQTSASEGEWSRVRSWDWTPNRIVVQAEGPGNVVFGEIAYPGWSATVDGQPASLERAHDILRAVGIPSGEHTIALEFRPWRLMAGIAITAITVVGLAGLWLRR